MAAQQIQPDFLNQFACKCGDCRRTCCRDWEVLVTRQELEARRSCEPGSQARALAEKNFELNPRTQGDDDHALCVLRADGYCSFLTAEKLCGWKVLRSEALCAACDNFPNTYISFEQDEYVFPSLSCEAIVELLLDTTEPIGLSTAALAQKRDRHQARIEAGNFSRRPLLALYPDLMRWGVAILQNRSFSLDDRMVLLANAMSLTDHLERNGRVAEIAGAMESFVDAESLEKILHKFDQFATGPQALLAINAHSLLRFVESSPYKAEAQRILNGLGIETEEVVEEGHVQRRLKPIDIEIYRARRHGLSGFLREREILFEHVMVCQYLRSMTPVTEPGVWDNFRFFNVCYALLKGSVIGNFSEAARETELADVIVVFHRMFAHNESASQHALELLDAGGLNDLAGMVALARG